MRPTIGRIVYFKTIEAGKFVERAAIVTEVVNDTTLHLNVFHPTEQEVKLGVKQGDSEGEWDWMPYQKHQAQKDVNLREELMAQLNRGKTSSITKESAIEKPESFATLHNDYFNGIVEENTNPNRKGGK